MYAVFHRPRSAFRLLSVAVAVCFAFAFIANAFDVGRESVTLDDGQGEKPITILMLKQELESLLRKSHVDMTVRTTETELFAEFKTRKFSVHALGKDGEASEEPTERIGPQAHGFIVRMSFVDEQQGGQANGDEFLNGEFRRLYWSTYKNEIKMNNNEKHIRLVIDYGVHRDRRTLDAVVRMVMRHGEPEHVSLWPRRPERWAGN